MVNRGNPKKQKSTTAKSKAKKTSTLKKAKNKSNIIPNIRSYLLPDIINCYFENDTLRFNSAELINSLLSTGDLNYLRRLSSIKSIYQEKIFFRDQIKEWNKLAYQIQYFENDTDNIPELLLETVVEGFKRAIITYKSKKIAGRSPKEVPNYVDLKREYIDLQNKLMDSGITDRHRKEIAKCKESMRSIKNRELKNTYKQESDIRKGYIIKFLAKEKFILTKSEINKLVLKTNAQISKKILARKYELSEKMIKRLLSQNTRYKTIIEFELSDGEIITFDYKFYKNEELKAKEQTKDSGSHFDLLYRRLNIPEEKIESIRLDYKKLRTPHLPKTRRRKAHKI